eukprot:TRINITY_DN23010_c0_g1_i1.p1 TRINITY_DN23010_c0_g1~~TRINITY_DN23010_c0_g1_i1.p1  ORF type:complete len:389 (+),score=160.16 TRINITY_DN23010_c0_g1_i1:87-1253(+)
MAMGGRKLKMYVAGAAVVGSALGYTRHIFKSADSRYTDFPDFSKHHNLMSSALTKTMYINYKNLFTPSGFTVDRCIQVGVDCPGGTVMGRRDPGIVAGDNECYDIFADLFDNIIRAYHVTVQAPVKDMEVIDDALSRQAPLDPRYVIALKARAYRNVENVPFSPAITRAGRRLVEEKVKAALELLPKELKGSYYPLDTMPQKVIATLTNLEVPFTKLAGEEARIGGIAREWPDARGVFASNSKALTVFVNGMHHVEMTSIEHSPDIAKLMNRLHTADLHLGEALRRSEAKYQWQQRLGFTGPVVPDLGNALELEVVMSLPKAANDVSFLRRLKELNLKAIPHADEDRGIWRLALKPSFASDTAQVKAFISAVNSLVTMEQAAAEAFGR